MNDARVATIWLAVAPFIYAACLMAPTLPQGIYGTLPAHATLAALLVGAYECIRRRTVAPRGHALGAYCVLMALLFGFAQRAMWGDWTGNPWVWHGLLPWADSGDYFAEAFGLLINGEYETLRGRALHTVTLAGLLHLSGFDLGLLSSLVTAGAASATALAGYCVWRSHGLGAAAIWSAMMFAFFHYFLGSLMTETLGYIYGALAFALLWESIQRPSSRWFVAALAAVTVAQCVRVGPLFVLPALALFAMFAWRTTKGRVHWRLGAGCIVLVVAVLFAHGQLNRALAPTSGGSFANAADSIYRLVRQGEVRLGKVPASTLRGSAPWLQIYDDNPGLAQMPQEARVAKKKEILVEAVKRSPLAAMAGAGREWNEYFFDFQFLPFPSLYDNDLAALAMAILTAIGLLSVAWPRANRYRWLVLAGNVAIFASVPFLVGGQTRVYAATMGFTAILTALGFVGLCRLRPPEDAPSANQTYYLSGGALATLITAGLATPLLLGGTLKTQLPMPSCPPGGTPHLIISGEPLRLDAKDDQRHAVSQARLQSAAAGGRKRAPDWLSKAVAARLQRAKTPLDMYSGVDIVSGDKVLFFLSTERQLATDQVSALCTDKEGPISMASVPSQ
ncbi:MAG: hypothetical protein HOI95_00505 [Chromatiales bacterium]|jgi:hypothetical protein|nr:hypothetical protein [Chromatiales bacterium]